MEGWGIPDRCRQSKKDSPTTSPSSTPTPNTRLSGTSSLGIPDPNAPVLASDFSSEGYWHPASNPQYIRNATCTPVDPVHFRSNGSTLDVQAGMHAACNLCLDLQQH